MFRKQSQQPQRLRKQPRVRRVQAAAPMAMPRLIIPKTARQRRWRNNRRFKLPTTALKQVIFTSRWVSLGLLALTIYALVVTGMDERFYLTVIPVEGTAAIPAAEIVEASGLGGAHIFAADPNQAAASIAGIPGVISATVTLGWPNQVNIRVKEDSPIAIWQEGDKQFWIMKDGRLLPARTDTLGLLVIEAEVPLAIQAETAETTAEETEEVQVEDPAPQAGLVFVPPDVLAGALQLKELRPNIEKLYFRPSGGLSYQDGRGWRAYFGTGTDMAQKLVIYETIVNDLLAREFAPTYISVSNQEKPYYLATGGIEE